jgi:hypothetical protein
MGSLILIHILLLNKLKKKQKMEFLEYGVTEIEDSVENIFCKPLENDGIQTPLSETQTKILYLALTLPENEINEMYKKVEKDFPLIKILSDRLDTLNCQTDKRSRIFISLLCDTPGKAVMYAYYLAYQSKKHNLDLLKIDDICLHILPNGCFTEESLHRAWDSQKVNTKGNPGSDNLLDYGRAALSLFR